MDGESLLVTNLSPADATPETNTQPIGFSQPNFWL